MRITKKVQYGLMLACHICKNGRSSASEVAGYIGLSTDFMDQVATKLRRGKVLVSYRGPGGGYELVPGATVGQVFKALDDVSLLKTNERLIANAFVLNVEQAINTSLSSVFNMTIEGLNNMSFNWNDLVTTTQEASLES